MKKIHLVPGHVRPAALALLCILSLTLNIQAEPTQTTSIPPGSSAAIAANNQSASPLPDTAKGRKIFRDAQSQQVRDTLQAAINSAGPGH